MPIRTKQLVEFDHLSSLVATADLVLVMYNISRRNLDVFTRRKDYEMLRAHDLSYTDALAYMARLVVTGGWSQFRHQIGRGDVTAVNGRAIQEVDVDAKNPNAVIITTVAEGVTRRLRLRPRVTPAVVVVQHIRNAMAVAELPPDLPLQTRVASDGVLDVGVGFAHNDRPAGVGACDVVTASKGCVVYRRGVQVTMLPLLVLDEARPFLTVGHDLERDRASQWALASDGRGNGCWEAINMSRVTRIEHLPLALPLEDAFSEDSWSDRLHVWRMWFEGGGVHDTMHYIPDDRFKTVDQNIRGLWAQGQAVAKRAREEYDTATAFLALGE